jgi:tyrosyl-tRNA synthetase
MGILPGTDGEVKMSKSLGNHIPLNSTPEDMYGKVMSVPDKAMGSFFRLVTRWTPDEIQTIEQGLAEGRLHPRDVKMKLAHEVVASYYSPEEARRAEQHFKRVFQQGTLPEDMSTYTFRPDETVLDILSNSGLIRSKSEGRRLIDQNGVRLDGEALHDPNRNCLSQGVLQVGKRHFIRLVKAAKSS